jgi:hypothetical protein
LFKKNEKNVRSSFDSLFRKRTRGYKMKKIFMTICAAVLVTGLTVSCSKKTSVASSPETAPAAIHTTDSTAENTPVPAAVPEAEEPAPTEETENSPTMESENTETTESGAVTEPNGSAEQESETESDVAAD